MNVSPIVDHPALSIEVEEQRMLVVGDLHIGIESEMRRKGVHVPSQTHRMEEELISLSNGHQRLVILGDVKHRVPGSTPQEHKEVPRFFESMLGVFDKVDVVKGNHDGYIENFVPEGVEVHPSSGLKVGEIGLVHGHTWPTRAVMGSKLLVMAHNHPTLMFKDGVGKRTSESCWIKAPMVGPGKRYIDVPEEMIVVPALNRALGGSPVNITGKRLLGPLLTRDMVALDEARIYLLDGISLGRLGDIMVDDRRKGSYRPHKVGFPL